MEIDYAEIVTSKPVSKFLMKFYLSDIEIQSLILVSPFVGTLEGTRVTLDGICKKAIAKNIPMYVITRAPEEEYHQQAIEKDSKTDRGEQRWS